MSVNENLLRDCKDAVVQFEIKHRILIEDVKRRKTNVSDLEKKYKNIEEAQKIIEVSAKRIFQRLLVSFEDLVSESISNVVKKEYNFHIDFKKKHGNASADIYLEDQDGNKLDAVESVGGGIVDIESISLRISMWAVSQKNIRPVFLLDEPFKNLSSRYRPALCEVINNLSRKLNIQFIIVTHEEELIEIADKVFNVSCKDNTSNVTIG
jgi:DNA repair exonuclease SbcCD ATPase subunit